MGDHRASVKITFEAHGITRKFDAWINWFPDSNGVDQRVVDFFRETWEECMAVYDEQVEEYHAKERERAEQAEYRRLQAKFGQIEGAQDAARGPRTGGGE